MNSRLKSKIPEKLPKQSFHAPKQETSGNDSLLKKNKSVKPSFSSVSLVQGLKIGSHRAGQQPQKPTLPGAKSPFRPHSPKRLFGQLASVKKPSSTEVSRNDRSVVQSSHKVYPAGPLANVKTEMSEENDHDAQPPRDSFIQKLPAQTPNPQFIAEIERKIAEQTFEPMTYKSLTFNKHCLYHPTRHSDFYSKINEQPVGFCSSCAVKLAGQSLEMTEIDITPAKGKLNRKESLDHMLKRIELTKPTFSNKKAELRTQKAALQKIFVKKKEILEKIFISLIDTLEKRKYLWDENLAQQFNREKKAIDKQLEAIENNHKCVEKIRSDISENYHAILNESNFDNFDSIYEHHQHLFDINIEAVNAMRVEGLVTFDGIGVKEIVERTEAFLEKELDRAYNGTEEAAEEAQLDATKKSEFEKKQSQPMHNLPTGGSYAGLPLIKKIGSMKDDFFTGSSSDKVISRQGRNGLASDAMRREVPPPVSETQERAASQG